VKGGLVAAADDDLNVVMMTRLGVQPKVDCSTAGHGPPVNNAVHLDGDLDGTKHHLKHHPMSP
jgi:hypothetical protein